MQTQFSLDRSFVGGASSSFCGSSRGYERLLPQSSPWPQECGYGCGPEIVGNKNTREKCFFLLRTCLLSPPAGRRMKIPRTREGKPRILCYPHSIPRRAALAVATAGVEPSVTARQTWSDPGAGALSVGSPACLPSSADSPTTPPASCPDHMTLLEYTVGCLTSGTRLFGAPVK